MGIRKLLKLLTDLKAEQRHVRLYNKMFLINLDPRFINWVSANKWYEKDIEMHVNML